MAQADVARKARREGWLRRMLTRALLGGRASILYCRVNCRKIPAPDDVVHRDQGQVIWPSTVDDAPPPTCTWQLVMVDVIELLFAAAV